MFIKIILVLPVRIQATSALYNRYRNRGRTKQHFHLFGTKNRENSW